jgi:hypothetical protein
VRQYCLLLVTKLLPEVERVLTDTGHWLLEKQCIETDARLSHDGRV